MLDTATNPDDAGQSASPTRQFHWCRYCRGEAAAMLTTGCTPSPTRWRCRWLQDGEPAASSTDLTMSLTQDDGPALYAKKPISVRLDARASIVDGKRNAVRLLAQLPPPFGQLAKAHTRA